MDEFTVATTESGTTVRVAVRGDVDLATAEELRAAVVPLIRAGREVDLDCAEIGFLDSAGLRVLLDLNRRAGDAGGELVLVGLPDIVSRVLELAGVAQMFTVRPGS